MSSPKSRYKGTNRQTVQSVQTAPMNQPKSGVFTITDTLKPAPALGLYRLYRMYALYRLYFVRGS